MRSLPTTDKYFVQSSLLFKFCHEVLLMRNKNSKPHDQELGNILNYNASDTSHWKRGKKSVKSIYALEALSKHLEIDFEILQDISDGTLDFEEALFEFHESENYKNFLASQTSALAEELAERKDAIGKLVQKIHQKANVETCPVFIPELFKQFPFIEIVARGINDKLARATRVRTGQYAIHCRKGEMQPHTRIAIVRELARILLLSERENLELPPRNDVFSLFEIHELSNSLLVPTNLLREEFIKVSLKKNVIQMIANAFWVPKSVIRMRLSNIIQSSLPQELLASNEYTINKESFTNTAIFNSIDYSEEDGEEATSSGN